MSFDCCENTKMSCSHFQRYRAERGLGVYKMIQSRFVFCKDLSARKEKVYYCVCFTCGTSTMQLRACLECVYFGCYPLRHIHEHAESQKHNFAIDMNYGSLYCFSCKDSIYAAELDGIMDKCRERHIKNLGINVPYLPWEPDNLEIDLIKSHTSRMCVTESSYIGLRGVLNLGKTCYLNCILQVLMHTPVLRDYFLSDRHTCLCSDVSLRCLMCEMASLFQEFYTGKTTPFIPSHLLYLVWTHANQLVGNVEQDAHEFFLETLNILHKHSKGLVMDNMQDIDFNKCDCVVDQVFTGILQSNVQCRTCTNISSAVEPFRDIGLGIGKPEGEAGATTLEDCLKRFTMVEDMANVNCKQCKSAQPSTKQMIIEKLPIIASFHLKRFEQKYDILKKNNGAKRNKAYVRNSNSTGNLVPLKNKTKVLFPECIDLSQFTIYQSPSSFPFSHFDSKYRLFAVVEHDGVDIESGHYISYIRLHKDRWFKCSDLDITAVDLNAVLDSQGYVLFYHKNILEYE